MPMAFLGATFFSLENVPPIAGKLLLLLPLTHSSLCLRAAMLGWDFPVFSLLVLTGYSLFFFCMGIRAFGKGDLT
jgi:ABC-type polysaccharide/polyol phosphate export permease